jgi:hypothetical protein
MRAHIYVLIYEVTLPKVYHSGNAVDVYLKAAWFEFGPVIVCPK